MLFYVPFFLPGSGPEVGGSIPVVLLMQRGPGRTATRSGIKGRIMQSTVHEVLSSNERLLIDQAIAEHENHPGALLGILEAVQSANAHKYLSMEALRYIAEETGVPAARIYSAATFYALFNLEPQGDNVICVCRGTACHTRGSRDLLEKLCLDMGLGGQEPSDSN